MTSNRLLRITDDFAFASQCFPWPNSSFANNPNATIIRLPPAYVASDGSRPNRNQSATATKKTLNLLSVSARLRDREVSNTHTEATEAKTGLVHVTSARRAVIETRTRVSMWLIVPEVDVVFYVLEPAETDNMT